MLWRDEAGNRIDFQPYTGYDLDNSGQPVYGYAAMLSLMQVNRSEAKPLLY